MVKPSLGTYMGEVAESIEKYSDKSKNLVKAFSIFNCGNVLMTSMNKTRNILEYMNHMQFKLSIHVDQHTYSTLS